MNLILGKDLFEELSEVYSELGHLVFENEKQVIVYIKNLGGEVNTSDHQLIAKLGDVHCEFDRLEDGYIHLILLSVEQNDKKLIIMNME